METVIEAGLGLLKTNLETLACRWFVSTVSKRLGGGAEESEVDVLHLSEHYLVVNKRFDLVINSDDPEEPSLEMSLRATFPKLVNQNISHGFYFVHRLDFCTSGIICLALHKKACAAASTAFQERKTKKYYLALLRGHIKHTLMDINSAIGEDATEHVGNHRMCTTDDPNCILPRDAHTRLLVLEYGEYKQFPATKVLLRPITGRRHQLRVHCSSIGHTIVGDYTYSNTADTEPYRTFLHAYRLILPNKLETLDIRTADPFTKKTGAPDWKPEQIVNVLDDTVFSKLGLSDTSP